MNNLNEEKQYWMQFVQNNKYRSYSDNIPLLKDAPEYIQKDWDIALQSILIAKENVYHIHPFLTSQKAFLLEVIAQYKSCSLYLHFPKHMQEDLELFHLSYMKSCSDLRYLPSHLKTKSFLLTLMNINGLGFEFVPPNLKDDDDLIQAALNNNVAAIEFIPKKKRIILSHDKALVDKIIEEAPHCFSYLSLKVRNNMKYAQKAIEKIPKNLEHSLKLKDNEQFVKEAITHHKCSIYYASERLQQNIELTLLSLKQGTASFYSCAYTLGYNFYFCCEGVAIHASHYKDVPIKYKYADEIIENLLQHDSFESYLEEPIKNYIKNIKKEEPNVDVKQLLRNIVLEMKLKNNLEEKVITNKRKI